MQARFGVSQAPKTRSGCTNSNHSGQACKRVVSRVDLGATIILGSLGTSSHMLTLDGPPCPRYLFLVGTPAGKRETGEQC